MCIRDSIYIARTSLGECFQVNYLDRSQVTMFIRNELTKAVGTFNPDYMIIQQRKFQDFMETSETNQDERFEEIKQEKETRRKISQPVNEEKQENNDSYNLISPGGPSRQFCQIVQTPSTSYFNGMKSYNQLREWSVDQRRTQEDAKRGMSSL